MRYGAVLIAAGERPGTYNLGRFRLDVGQWVWEWRHTYVARPVSAPQMLRLHAAEATGTVAERTTALATVLRAAFPRTWRTPFIGDPVRIIFGLPVNLRKLVVESLFTIPGSAQSATRELTATERAAAEQRRAVLGPQKSRGALPTLATAVAYVRARYGDAWYFNPARWNTSDGYVPFAMVWVEYVALDTVAARDRLSAFQAGQLGSTDPRAKRLRDDEVHRAYPGPDSPQAMH